MEVCLSPLHLVVFQGFYLVHFSWWLFWSLPHVQCYEPPSIVPQGFCLSDLTPWVYLSLPLYNHKGFDLGYTQQWPQAWKRSVFIPIPKKDSAKECSNYCTIAFISHASKIVLKILQARPQQYVNRELPDVQAGFRKGRGTRHQIVNIRWIIEKAKEFQKDIYFCFIDYAKAFDCVDHNKPWKILQEMGIPDHLTCLLRNLYALKKQ